MTGHTQPCAPGPRAPDPGTWAVGMRATWLVAMIATHMDEQPDGTAHLALSAGMVGCMRDLVADTATTPA